MGPKPKGGKKQKPEPEETKPEEEPEPTPDPVVIDPYEDLRYYPYPVIEEPRKRKQMTRRIPVLKRVPRPQIVRPYPVSSNVQQTTAHLAPSFLPKKRPEKLLQSLYTKTKTKMAQSSKTTKVGGIEEDYTALNIKVVAPNQMSVYVSPGELPVTPPPLEILRHQPDMSFAEFMKHEQNFTKEKKSLKLFEKEKLMQFKMENYLMEKTGKERGGLLIRRKQLLPKINEYGEERAVMMVERTETPEEFPATALFCEARKNAAAKNGLYVTLARRDQGYNVVTDWLGCPEVTDLILDKLGLASRSLFASSDTEGPPDVKSGEYIPKIAPLGVVGSKYEDVQKRFCEVASIKEVPDQRLHIVTSEKVNEESKRPLFIGSSCSFRYHMLPADASADPRVSLAFGDTQFAWSTDPEKSQQKWIVEMGCTAELGRNGVGSTTMENTGTTAIHFNWVKYPHKDAFQLNRWDLERFVFDCWGGVILPNETLRLPFLYKSLEPGYYSEDWRLLTKPVLENNGHIIMRLWGITRQFDPFFRAREIIEKKLHVQMTRSITKHRVDKIIDYLPLKEVPLKDTRFPFLHLGPDLFHSNHPWLKYNSASVYRLGKLAELILDRKEQREAILCDQSSELTSSSGSAEATSELSGHSVQAEAPATNQWDYDYLDDEQEEGEEEGEEEETFAISPPLEVVTNEFSVSHLPGGFSDKINHLIGVLNKKIDPDSLQAKIKANGVDILYAPTVSPSYVTRGTYGMNKEKSAISLRKHPKAPINLVKANFVLGDMRKEIQEDDESLEMQEALFTVMATEISKLAFRTNRPFENWKLAVGHNLLCDAMDKFSDFAQYLHLKCCQGQEQEQLQEELALEQTRLISNKNSASTLSDSNESDEMKSPPPAMPRPSTNQNESARSASSDKSISDKERRGTIKDKGSSHSTETRPEVETLNLQCQDMNPRIGLKFERFQNQYYTGLHMKMYQLLSDFVDSFASLFSEGKDLCLDYDQLGFTRIEKVPMHVSVESILKAPLPPKWVKLAQRMETTRIEIRNRKKEVEEAWHKSHLSTEEEDERKTRSLKGH